MATYRFMSYSVQDESIRLDFNWDDATPGSVTEISVRLTDTELASITTQLQLRNAVISKLQRKVQATGVASKLDPFIGQSLTI